MAQGGQSRLEARRGALWLTALLLAALIAGAGCGSSGRNDDPQSRLEALLLPASRFPVTVVSRFEWTDPSKFVSQGLVLPAAGQRGAASTIDRAGFKAGAGQLLAPEGAQIAAFLGLAKFGSARGAALARDYLHTRDLIRPCSRCDMKFTPWPVGGIPDAKGAHQRTTSAAAPASRPAFERYLIEFTIGHYLFLGRVTGPPGLVPPDLFEGGMHSAYAYARQRLG